MDRRAGEVDAAEKQLVPPRVRDMYLDAIDPQRLRLLRLYVAAAVLPAPPLHAEHAEHVVASAACSTDPPPRLAVYSLDPLPRTACRTDMKSSCCWRHRLMGGDTLEGVDLRRYGRGVAPRLLLGLAAHTRSCFSMRSQWNVRPQWRHGCSGPSGDTGSANCSCRSAFDAVATASRSSRLPPRGAVFGVDLHRLR